MFKFFCLLFKHIQPGRCAYPYISFFIFQHGVNIVICNAVYIFGVVAVSFKVFLVVVVPANPASQRGHPQVAVFTFCNTP